ncbi:MAG TPA: S9 family peptidase [Thermoanaerobaculia bacterium]|nr:S9 family peptidase [Thermoanaerobaculia bacterium]
MKRIAVLLLTLLALPAAAQLTPADFAGLRDVGAPRLSPDGNWIAYTVRQASFDDDKNHRHIWIAGWDGKENRQLTFSKDSESSPKWSPDGKSLAFISSRGVDDDIDQLWVISMQGGEAEKVTEFKGGVTDFSWAPDGKRLALAVEDAEPKVEKDKSKPPIVINRFQFKKDIEGYLGVKRQHLYLFELASKKSEPLTPGVYDEGLPAFSPDGTQLAFVSKRHDDIDRTNDWDVFVIDAKPGATPRQLTTTPNEDNDPETESELQWSADGKSIAFLQGGDPKLLYYARHHVAIVHLDGKQEIVSKEDRAASNPHWLDGNKLTYLLEDDRTQSLKDIAGGKRTIIDYDIAGGHTVLLSSDDDHPAELFAADGRQITHHNDEWLASHKLGTTKELDFKSKDGTEIHGFVVTPPNYDAAKKYPAILRIHGGPVSQFSHRFSFEWQLFATNGYIVVAANPRGSSGRGEAFSKAIWADWGHLDAQDVLAAVDAVVARGMADPNRLGAGGWSYGGILTNYVIAQDHRFKAATSGASISNILAGYGTDEYVREYELELGRPWEHPDVWMKISFPFLHADRINTPTLFLAGDKDFNVPLLNSEQMYQALRSLGVPAELIIYPGQYHGLTKPGYVRDRYQRYLDWYAKYVK